MKRILNYITLFALCIILSACIGDDGNDDFEGGNHINNTPRRSVIVYMAAQNSLGFAGASRLDSAEIVNGFKLLNSQTDNMFLFIDDKRPPRLYRIYRYRNHTFIDKVLTWKEDICSSDPATLHEVLTHVATNYSSESYGLVMWSHGDGWLSSTSVINTLKGSARSFGIDVGQGGDMTTDRDATGKIGPQMDICDMADAISKSGIHLDYLFFDACLMQGIEVAYELKDVANYVIGSACSTSAYGAYYTNLIPKALFAYPANNENIALIVSQCYYDVVENPNLQKYYRNAGIVISAIKTERLQELASLTGTMLAEYLANKTTPDTDGVQAYSSSEIYDFPDFYDMGSLMHKILPAEDYANWLSLANQCIVAHRESSQFIIGTDSDGFIYGNIASHDHLLGVSMYLPEEKFNGILYSNYNAQFKTTLWYKDANWEATGW